MGLAIEVQGGHKASKSLQFLGAVLVNSDWRYPDGTDGSNTEKRASAIEAARKPLTHEED